MGLDFTSIPDREGPAVYMLHGPGVMQQQQLEKLRDDITKLTSNQVVLIDVNSPDGENIREFYAILPEQLPAIMLIRDDDSLIQLWTGSDLPAADTIVYYLHQESSE